MKNSKVSIIKMAVAFALFLSVIHQMAITSYAAGFSEERIVSEVVFDEEQDYIAQYDGQVVKGPDIVLKNVTVLDSGSVIVTNVQPVSLLNSDSLPAVIQSYPEKTKTASFSHNIYDRNNAFIASVNVMITGIYSQVDGGSAQIQKIVCGFPANQVQNFRFSESINGDVGVVYLYWYGGLIARMTYKIYSNGNIQCIEVVGL